MPASADELVALLDLEDLDVNLFRGRQPETSLQRVFGGQVAAQALLAAARTVDPAYVAHSLHSYFLLPGDTAVPIIYDVERLRDGRSFGTRRVVARQHGRPIYYLTANFQRAEEGFEHQDVMPERHPARAGHRPGRDVPVAAAPGAPRSGSGSGRRSTSATSATPAGAARGPGAPGAGAAVDPGRTANWARTRSSTWRPSPTPAT